MAIVTRQFIENGKRVVELSGVSVMTSDIFKNAVRISKEKKTADEFRLTINEWQYVFYRGTSYKDLKTAYSKYVNEKPLVIPVLNFSN